MSYQFDANAVPEPTTILLFSAGLGLLFRKKPCS
ncbi:MAG: PEP-CTERM sorting domain-containing protein [Candidatus Omnitrophica bacterium]|nr:PEP-CTERM sorting domain-containing protein [Candidatus Omnitrophota bacterium]